MHKEGETQNSGWQRAKTTFVIIRYKEMVLIIRLLEPESVSGQSLMIWGDAKPRALAGSGFGHLFISALCLSIFLKRAILILGLLNLLNSVMNLDT